MVGIGCNCLLVAIKVLAGILTGSVSILADAMNNLSDAASSVITLLGFRLAQRPADADHPYGHARYEYLTGLGVAVLILIIGVELGEASIRKILAPQAMDITGLTLGILVASMVIKIWMSYFFRSLGNLIQSTTLMATSADSRNDVIATGAVLLSCLIQKLWNVNVDGITGLSVAVFILYSGIAMMRQTISPLLGKQADAELVKSLTELLTSHDKILGIHDLLIHDYGPGRCFASVHAELSATEGVLHSHEIIDDLEQLAKKKLNIHLVIHYDPVVLDDPEWNTLRKRVEEVIASVDPRLSIHDFRLSRQLGNLSLAFDVEVPYEMGTDYTALRETLEHSLKNAGVDCPLEITFDGKA